MSTLSLLVALVRYRVAVMLVLFFALSLTYAGRGLNSINFLLVSVAFVFSYVSATTINDIVDKKIDLVNHKNNSARPYANNKVTYSQMVWINVISSAASLVIGVYLGLFAFLILLASLVINYMYSLPPIQISYRTYFAHVFLSFAYVGLPFLMGVVISDSVLSWNYLLFGLSLLFLFYGRIFLKDFRDMEGDKLHHKPTFVLKFGKKKTILLSLTSIGIGNLLLILSLSQKGVAQGVLPVIELFFLLVYFSLYRLYQARTREDQLLFIALGAKVGNGVLVGVLGCLMLLNVGASLNTVVIFLFGILVFYFLSFYQLLRSRAAEISVYKG